MTAPIPYGTRVEGPLWPEPIHIFAYQPLPDGGFHIVGILTNLKTPIDVEISATEASELRTVQSQVNFTGSARRAFLNLEAKRYRYAALYNPTLEKQDISVEDLQKQLLQSQIEKTNRFNASDAVNLGCGLMLLFIGGIALLIFAAMIWPK